MLDGLPLTILDGISVVGLVLLFGILLATNRLYTRGQVQAIEAAHAREVERMNEQHLRELEDVQHDRGEWRTESRLNQQTITEQAGQITALASGFETLRDFLTSLRRLGVGAVESGDHK